jgi:hypothetical protein
LLGGLPWAEVILEKPGHRLLHELTSKVIDFVIPTRTFNRETESAGD